ncbi:MAG: hypothetical protein FWC61_04160 [Proteobacteria bacterium]|nr:hypothetical protein [Pseudomonadota bacterium]
MNIKTQILHGKQRIIAKGNEALDKLENTDFIENAANRAMLVLSYVIVILGAAETVAYPIAGIINKANPVGTVLATALGLAIAAGGAILAKTTCKAISKKKQKDIKHKESQLNRITEINLTPSSKIIVLQVHLRVKFKEENTAPTITNARPIKTPGNLRAFLDKITGRTRGN